MSNVARSLLAGLLMFSPMVAISEQELSVTVTPLKGGLHLLAGLGGNVVASVGGDGVLLIDDDYPQYASAYEKALMDLGMNEAPRFVLNTHWHGDHTGNNNYWGERGSVIIAHNNVLQRMSTRQEMKAQGRIVEPSPHAALPVVTFERGLALHFNGDDIEMQHFPSAHTDGDSIIFFARENVVHMGDHFFNGRFPFVDFGSGGSLRGYIDNVGAVLNRIDERTIVVPGHGLVGNKADLARFHAMILATSEIVKDRRARGLSVEDITQEGLGDQWASWGQHFIKESVWISFLAH